MKESPSTKHIIAIWWNYPTHAAMRAISENTHDDYVPIHSTWPIAIT